MCNRRRRAASSGRPPETASGSTSTLPGTGSRCSPPDRGTQTRSRIHRRSAGRVRRSQRPAPASRNRMPEPGPGRRKGEAGHPTHPAGRSHLASEIAESPYSNVSFGPPLNHVRIGDSACFARGAIQATKPHAAADRFSRHRPSRREEAALCDALPRGTLRPRLFRQPTARRFSTVPIAIAAFSCAVQRAAIAIDSVMAVGRGPRCVTNASTSGRIRRLPDFGCLLDSSNFPTRDQ